MKEQRLGESRGDDEEKVEYFGITILRTTTAPLSENERIGARRGVSGGLCPTALIDKKLVRVAEWGFFLRLLLIG